MKNLKKKGLFLLLTIFVLTVFAGCGKSTPNTTANTKLNNYVICSSIDNSGKPLNKKDKFSTKETVMYATAEVSNISKTSTVRVAWYYYQGNTRIRLQSVTEKLKSDKKYVSSKLQGKGSLPKGNYEVAFYVDNKDKPVNTIKIVVE